MYVVQVQFYTNSYLQLSLIIISIMFPLIICRLSYLTERSQSPRHHI